MQSAPAVLDPPALPPISKGDARRVRFLRPMTLTFDLWNPSLLALHLLVPWVTSMPILIFLCFSVLELRAARRGQTDGKD